MRLYRRATAAKLTVVRYGVSRVYAQQCGYVLHDAEAARNNMRALAKMMHQAGLAPEGVHKATYEHMLYRKIRFNADNCSVQRN